MPKVNVSSMKMNALSGLTELIDSIQSFDRDVNSVENIFIVIDKYQKYKEYIHSFLSDIINIGAILSRDKYSVNGLFDLGNSIMQQYRPFAIGLAKYLSRIDITQFTQNEVIFIKSNYYNLCDSSICEKLMKICVNLKRSKIKQHSFDEFIFKCKSREVVIPIVEGLDAVDSPKRLTVIEDFTKIDNIDEYLAIHPNQEVYDLILKIVSTGTLLYELRFSPDFDISRVFDGITSMLDNFGEEFRGCGNAMNIIKNSKAIFEKNFSRYYKSSQVTQNPFSLLTDYIGDIVASVGDEKSNVSIKDLNGLKKISFRIKKMITEKMANVPKNQIPKGAEGMVSKIDSIFEKFMGDDAEVNIEDLTNSFQDMFAAQP